MDRIDLSFQEHLAYWEGLREKEHAHRGKMLLDSPFYDLSERLSSGLITNIVMTTSSRIIEANREEYKVCSPSNLFIRKRSDLEKMYAEETPEIYSYFVRQNLNLSLREAVNRGISPIIETNVPSPFI